MKPFSFLRRKLPVDGNVSNVRIAAVVAAIVFFVLFFFRPFGLMLYKGSVLGVALVFGAVSFLITFLYCRFFFYPLTLRAKEWRVWQHGACIFLLIVIISIGNVFADMILFHHGISWKAFVYYLIATLIIGVPVTAVIIALSYQKKLRNKLELLLDKDAEARQGKTITFHDDGVRSDDLTIQVNDFLYAEVIKNNVIVYYQQNGMTMTHEMRMTLQNLVNGIDYPNIIQCHRSFVVNVDNITSAKGNSNGYKLLLGKCTNVVPVSRSFVPKLKSFIA